MRPSPPLPAKKDVALALLANSSVFIHLDPRASSVMVPPSFKHQPNLVLQVGLNMPVPIPDLHLDDQGMSCTLSFSRVPFHCVLPWSAVYAMVDDEGRAMVWPDDVPPEVAQQAKLRTVGPVAAEEKAAPKKEGSRRARLEEVRSSSESSGATAGKKTKGKGRAEPKAAPRLAAVPPPSRDGARGPQRSDKSKPSLAEDEASRPAAPAATPKPAPAPSVGARRPKRELPPYLRVIK